MRNKLIIVSGPSGSGKTSTMRSVMSNELISSTTRAPREGEVDGSDYYFITDGEFYKTLSNGGFVEYSTYYNNAYYGLTVKELHKKLKVGDAFVVVDVEGKKQIDKYYQNTLSLFFDINREEAIKRMVARGDQQSNIYKRLKTFNEELENYYLYDYVIDNNGKSEDTIEAVKYILEIEGVNIVS